MRAARLLLGKDLRVLWRSPLLLGALVAYPLLIALLVALVAGYANTKPRVALVDEDRLPSRVEIGARTFDVDATFREVGRNVELVRLSRADAKRELEHGRVVAVVTVPPGFIADLRGMVRSPTLVLETTRGGLAPRVTQQVQALVYSLNRQLQQAYIDANLEYVDLIRRGGTGTILGREYEVLGLTGAERLLDDLPPDPRLDDIRAFVRAAEAGLAETGDTLRATANPIELRHAPERGRTWSLSAQVQGYALAVTVAFLALLLAAGSLGAERDENVLARLQRGLASPTSVLAAKLVLAALVSTALGLALAVAFGAAVELGDVPGGQPWTRMPLLALGLALAGAAVGALGTLFAVLARDARTAAIVSLVAALPIVFLGLVPREAVPAAGHVSDALPFSHAVRFFVGALYDESPWRAVGREAAWLAGLALAFGAAARAGMRRLAA